MDIQPSVLKQFLSYDRDTGAFTRIEAASPRQARRVGKACGGVNAANGYVTMQVDGRPRYAHRLAWIYVHGEIPAGVRIDHANRDRSDNRICNLRLASHADNLRNCKLRPDNTTGVKGVWFDRSRGQFAVSVGRKHVGRFDTLLEAAAARASAARKAFGEFATE